MAETGSIVKIVVILGIMFLLVAGLYPGSESGWTNFSAALNAFPTFNNPFTENAVITTFIPDARDVSETTDYEDAVGCTDAEYWRCVTANDGDTSYILLGPDGIRIAVNMSDPDYDGIIQRLTVEIICRSITSAPPIRTFAYNGNLDFVNGATCPVSEAYSSMKFDINFPWTIGDVDAGSAAIVLDEDLIAAGQRIRITYIEVNIYTTRDPACSGFECVNRFFDSVAKGILFVVNGLIFIGQVIAYLIGVAVAFFGMFAFFLAIPGAPTFIQAIFTIFIVGCAALIVISVVRIIRGNVSPV